MLTLTYALFTCSQCQEWSNSSSENLSWPSFLVYSLCTIGGSRDPRVEFTLLKSKASPSFSQILIFLFLSALNGKFLSLPIRKAGSVRKGRGEGWPEKHQTNTHVHIHPRGSRRPEVRLSCSVPSLSCEPLLTQPLGTHAEHCIETQDSKHSYAFQSPWVFQPSSPPLLKLVEKSFTSCMK